jgi:hypothetical protein
MAASADHPKTLTSVKPAGFSGAHSQKGGTKRKTMKSKAAVLVSCLLFLAVLVQVGVALGSTPAAPQESTVTSLPDGSIVIEGYIKYDKALNGYVVQALVPQGNFGRYVIANPEDGLLEKLARQGDVVVVQGYQTGAAFSLEVQSVNGKAYSQ